MSRRSIITNITPLPASISREAAVAQLHDHAAMIELNPLVIRHILTDPPANASQDEADTATWYEITDRINYLPGGAVHGEVSYKACFYDLPRGLQTHVFAPAGVDIRSKWAVEGSLPGEPRQPVELGVDLPRDGLYIREDVDLRCNILMIGFVKRNLKKSHHVVAEKIVHQASLKQQEGSFPVPRSASTTAPSTDNETASNPYRRNTASPVRPVQTHYSFPAHCACETDQHHPRCPHYQSVGMHPGYPVSPVSSYPLASIVPLSPIHYPELYGSSPNNQCQCTGALHSEGCASYPGLRFPMRSGSNTLPAAPQSIQTTPASLYAAMHSSASTDLNHSPAPYRGDEIDPDGLYSFPGLERTDSEDLPNPLRPLGTIQIVHELEGDQKALVSPL